MAKRRKAFTAEARQRMSEAQKARWAVRRAAPIAVAADRDTRRTERAVVPAVGRRIEDKVLATEMPPFLNSEYLDYARVLVARGHVQEFIGLLGVAIVFDKRKV